jgi:hypothetical protein
MGERQMNNKLKFIKKDVFRKNEFVEFLKESALLPYALKIKVAQKIDEYLNGLKEDEEVENSFPFVTLKDLMFSTDSLVFGGAVRDAIAGLEVHDIDIVALPRSANTISERLLKNDFKLLDKTTIDLAIVYKNLIISEPWTFYRGNTFVQIIRPRGEKETQAKLTLCVSEVDLSCCGVSFHPSDNLITEQIKDAIKDCEKLQYRIMPKSKFFNKNRIYQRMAKLDSRGWKCLTTYEEMKNWS